MTDIIDRAQAMEELYRDRSLDGVRRAAAQLLGHPAPSNVCGCGDMIEEERRRAAPGARRCMSCQAALERRQQQYRSS